MFTFPSILTQMCLIRPQKDQCQAFVWCKNNLSSSSVSENEKGDTTEFYKLSAGIPDLFRFSGFQEVKVSGYSPTTIVMSDLVTLYVEQTDQIIFSVYSNKYESLVHSNKYESLVQE